MGNWNQVLEDCHYCGYGLTSYNDFGQLICDNCRRFML